MGKGKTRGRSGGWVKGRREEEVGGEGGKMRGRSGGWVKGRREEEVGGG